MTNSDGKRTHESVNEAMGVPDELNEKILKIVYDNAIKSVLLPGYSTSDLIRDSSRQLKELNLSDDAYNFGMWLSGTVEVEMKRRAMDLMRDDTEFKDWQREQQRNRERKRSSDSDESESDFERGLKKQFG